MMSNLADFKFSVPIEVRFSDLDGMVHVNNALYFTYFEEARNAYWRRLRGGNSLRDLDFILARAECDFRSPAMFGEVLDVYIRVGEMKSSSFTFEYQIVERQSKRVVASGRSVQVLYDYSDKRAKQIPDDLCHAIAEFEGQEFKRA